MYLSQRDYGTAGTNAAPRHDILLMDDTYHDRLNPPPVSKGINEEIHIQADLQWRQQQQDEFEYGLAYDPYLICHKCNCMYIYII